MVDDARQVKERGQTAVTALLGAMALDKPTVVLLEDLHWADRASIELVEHVADDRGRGPLLLICAARPSLSRVVPRLGPRYRRS